MSRQWMRHLRITLGSGSESIDFSNLRVTFKTQHWTVATPANADIRIYNPSKATAEKVVKEFTKVTLEAGYNDNYGVIFSGEAIQRVYRRENPTDTYLRIIARDGDQAHNYAVVSKALPKGHTYRDQVQVAFEAMKEHGISLGFIGDLGPMKMIRGASLVGMARDILRDVCRSTDSSWWIEQGKLYVVPNKTDRPGDVIVLNSNTGMVGMPAQTVDGVQVDALLNPNFRPGGRVHINQESIQQWIQPPAWASDKAKELVPTIAADGLYKIWCIDTEGDSRGNPWYSHLTCTRLDAGQAGSPMPLGIIQQGVPIPD